MLTYLACPNCQSRVKPLKNGVFCSKCKIEFRQDNNGVINMLPKNIDTLSQDKWNSHYKKHLNKIQISTEQRRYMDYYGYDTINQITKYWKPKRKQIYLEIGSGPCYLGAELAKNGVFVIGVDYSYEALVQATKLFKLKELSNCLFILGDINSLPIQESSIDFIYGGGVIEHFRNMDKVTSEMYRVLKKNAIAYNTVPFLNLGALTYRQLWGNIPFIPGVRQLFEFIHITLLKGKHMRFGYELAFLPSTLKKLHQKAGFRKIIVSKFDAKIMFEYIKRPVFRNLALKVVRSDFFWPVLYIAARK